MKKILLLMIIAACTGSAYGMNLKDLLYNKEIQKIIIQEDIKQFLNSGFENACPAVQYQTEEEYHECLRKQAVKKKEDAENFKNLINNFPFDDIIEETRRSKEESWEASQ